MKGGEGKKKNCVLVLGEQRLFILTESKYVRTITEKITFERLEI